MTDASTAGGGDAVVPEPYQSLYRRFRPQRFEEVRGQEHVSRALRNAVRDGRVAHAYLFSGPRGTGKTSTARILAMALNCEHPADGEPDGTCGSCVEIRRGASVDVHELDAASNRKLDEMRELLSRVALGTRGRWKVYIVDEVHQLTPDASSALLKTLEEPPGHVVFVLATTDPQKVLQTIRSRTQHFEFRLLGHDVLSALLRDVNDRAHLGLPSEAIDMVVRRGQGSARDALSALDQVAALGEVDDDAATVGALVDALADRDAGRVLTAAADAVAAGRDPRRLVADVIAQLRNGFLATQARRLVMLPDDAAAEAERQARQLGLPALVRALEVLGEAGVDMRDAVDPRVTLEVALVRLAAPAADNGTDSLLHRIDRLEREVARLAGAPAGPAPGPAGVGRGEPGGRPGPAAAGRGSSSPAGPAPGPADPAPGPLGVAARGPASAPRRAVPPARPELGDPPPLPRPSGGSRPALGAHRRAPSAGAGPGAGTASGPGTDAGPVAGAGAGSQESGAAPERPAGQGGGGPSRDELSKAWGDHVLPRLPAAVKAFVSGGRWVDAGDGPTLALPDRGLLARAAPLRGDVEAALSAHFGRPVVLRLALDASVPPAAAGGAAEPEPAAAEDPSAYDLDAMEDAGAAVVSPGQRLLEAFPGAEEVSP